MKPSIIYLFVSPSGRAYAGKHEAWPDADRWPRRGSGPLPDGYRGSGKLWANVTKKHGPAIRWIILRRFQPGTARASVDNAERRAIRLARAIWGDGCVNVLEGGQGLTSAEARALQALPEVKAKVSAAAAKTNARPEVKARKIAATRALWTRPDYVAKVSAAAREASARPEAKAKRSAANRAAQNRPEVMAANSATQKAIAQKPERRAQLAEALEAARTPEVRARAAATKRINDGWRRLAQQHPGWWTLPPSSGP